MSEGRDKLKIRAILPWFLCLLLILSLIFVFLQKQGGRVSLYERVVREKEILSSMRLNLIKSAEAEKSAVLAVTDEESLQFADQARMAAGKVDKDRTELASLIRQDDSSEETARILEFERCWTESLKLDRLLLHLAVQNTNLHATNLALTRGSEAVDRLERDLDRLIDTGSTSRGDARIVRLTYQAVVASLKIQDLYTPHIQAESDTQMDAIEQKIRSNDATLTHSLETLSGLVPGSDAQIVKDATADYAELAKVTQEIISLSRRNTNIKSLELSLGKKRLITAQCDEVLGNLQELIRNKGTKATR
jgi:hypothetical protein